MPIRSSLMTLTRAAADRARGHALVRRARRWRSSRNRRRRGSASGDSADAALDARSGAARARPDRAIDRSRRHHRCRPRRRRARASSRCATICARHIEGFEQRLADVDARRKQLGDPPAAGAPPEDPAIATERTRLNQRHGEIDAALKQARLLDAARRRSRRAHHGEAPQHLHARIVRPRVERARSGLLGADRPAKLPETFEGVAWLLRSWWSFARDSAGYGRIAAALVTLHRARVGVFMLAGWVKRHVTRPGLVRHALCACVPGADHAAAHGDHDAGAGRAASCLILDGFGLMPARIMEIGLGLIAATALRASAAASASDCSRPTSRSGGCLPCPTPPRG